MNELIITNNQGEYEVTKDTEELVITTLKKVEEAKAAEALMRKALLTKMNDLGIKQIKTEKLTLTVKEDSTREKFDAKKLREDDPDLYDKYITWQKVTGALQIKCF